MQLDIDQLIPPEAVKAAKQDNEDFELWPEHVNALEVFQCCSDQWTVHLGLGVVYFQGLDWAKAASVARDWLGIQPTKTLLAQLGILVDEARQILNK